MSRKPKITLGKIIDQLLLNYQKGKTLEYVHHPYSWALYHTWEWCYQLEEDRREGQTND